MKTKKQAIEFHGFTAKLVPNVCGNCKHMTSKMELVGWMKDANYRDPGRFPPEQYGVEKEIRCMEHAFAVKKMSSCNRWEPK